MKIDSETFDLMFRQHLKTLEPNPGTNWLGKWAWKLKQRKEFKKQLKAEGYILL